MLPANVVEVLSRPSISVAAERLLLITLPLPLSEPMAWVAPLRSSVAPAEIVTGEVFGIALLSPAPRPRCRPRFGDS